MTRLLTTLFWTVALGAAPPAQDTLTLQQAIAEGLRAEPGVQAARADLEAARGDRQSAALHPNPDVSVEQREMTGGPDRQTAIIFDLPLDLFRRGPRTDAAARMVDRIGR